MFTPKINQHRSYNTIATKYGLPWAVWFDKENISISVNKKQTYDNFMLNSNSN